MANKFIFREGSRITGVKPEVAGRELERIRKTRGGLKSEDVVEEARPEAAPLHPVFEWDDSVAGEKFRRVQASTLIRSIQVERGNDAKETVYAYVPSISKEPGEYDRTDSLSKHVDRFTLALTEALKDLHSAQERVAELKRAAGDQPEDRVSVILLASQALQAAEHAIRTLVH